MNKPEVINYLENYNNESMTENGALGYRTTLHELLDLNFKVSSLRFRSEEAITEYFIRAYYENPKYAVKWMFFLRDVLEGLGERRSFRVCLQYLIESHPDIALAVMKLVPEYGRYDDLLAYVETDLHKEVCTYMKQQLEADIRHMKQGEPISLLAKWMPSVNTSSKSVRHIARVIAKEFGMSDRVYRKMLSSLRAYSNVVEVKMSANQWEAIDYEKVPAKAGMQYDNAFLLHDSERRIDYYTKVMEGNSKLNIAGIAPYEIVHRLVSGSNIWSCWGKSTLKNNGICELMWQKMEEAGFQNDWGLEDCIVVADGSGSMYGRVSGGSSVLAIEVCDALAIYFAEQLQGVFHNKAITFSDRPQFIDLSQGKSLKEKLEIMFTHHEVASTNIEAVFHMLLDMAISNQVPQEQLPKQVLVISDMEFNCATRFNQKLFDSIEADYQAAGYKIPRLIFWNVCGRTDTIPKVDNENGICLLSGFSQNAMKIAANREFKDPYESLIKVLDGPRYEAVEEAILPLVS